MDLSSLRTSTVVLHGSCYLFPKFQAQRGSGLAHGIQAIASYVAHVHPPVVLPGPMFTSGLTRSHPMAKNVTFRSFRGALPRVPDRIGRSLRRNRTVHSFETCGGGGSRRPRGRRRTGTRDAQGRVAAVALWQDHWTSSRALPPPWPRRRVSRRLWRRS